ncbi:MAG: M20/M25/M40 family metallo-hydrolase [Haloferacaceae archaeon]
MDEAIAEAVEGGIEGYREALFDLLERPSVSTTGEGMDAAADAVVSTLSRFGFDAVRRIETDRYPLVYAERTVDEDPSDKADGEGRSDGADDESGGRPTILFYGHYDVQPPGDVAEWETPPFEPTVRDGRIYARGVGDNKGQFLAHAFALDALDRAGLETEVDVKLLVEGGEESGSAGLREYLAGEPPELADADLLYVADGPMHAVAEGEGRRDLPTIAYGNRGVLSFQLDVRTARTDLHSGNFGGPVPAASNVLVDALASLREGDDVLVDGFYDGAEVADADRELARAIPAEERELRERLGVEEFAGDRPYYERLLLEPTMTINGLESGYRGDGMKTVLPATATAKLDCRLVPGQDPDAVFERIRDHLGSVDGRVEVTKQGTFPSAKTPVDAPAARSVREALSAVWGTEPVELPVLGGSLPAAYFRRVPALADVPLLVVPYANHDQGNHSPNENLSLDCFRNGIATSAEVVRRFR